MFYYLLSNPSTIFKENSVRYLDVSVVLHGKRYPVLFFYTFLKKLIDTKAHLSPFQGRGTVQNPYCFSQEKATVIF